MVQQIATELSDATAEQGYVAVATIAVLRLLKNNSNIL
jgi:hypothetical protein